MHRHSKDPRKPTESRGFNWRFLLLFAMAFGLLAIAFSNKGNGKGSSKNGKSGSKRSDKAKEDDSKDNCIDAVDENLGAGA